jgi:peptidoglycan/LPS O-acetylase OafA/YrhL
MSQRHNRLRVAAACNAIVLIVAIALLPTHKWRLGVVFLAIALASIVGWILMASPLSRRRPAFVGTVSVTAYAAFLAVAMWYLTVAETSEARPGLGALAVLFTLIAVIIAVASWRDETKKSQR